MLVINAFVYIGILFYDLYHIVKALRNKNYTMHVKFFRFYINISGECVE